MNCLKHNAKFKTIFRCYKNPMVLNGKITEICPIEDDIMEEFKMKRRIVTPIQKLQALYEAGICFSLTNDDKISWFLFSEFNEHTIRHFSGCLSIEDAIFELWEAAKREYPDKDCFKSGSVKEI